jgi:hypothetical protein
VSEGHLCCSEEFWAILEIGTWPISKEKKNDREEKKLQKSDL